MAEPTPAPADTDSGATGPLAPVRRFVAGKVRGAVAGRSPEQRHAELFETDGPRWFEEGSPIQRVHADSAMFVGGLRALLLQSLHPLAMAGVAEHSDYRADPWGRLQRTADFLAATTYGPASEAERAVARVRSVHTRVTGTASDGRSYAANDPHLLRWVHVAEVDSFLAANQRYAAHPVAGSERDEYVRQMAVIARALGVPAPPETVQALHDQLRAVPARAAQHPRGSRRGSIPAAPTARCTRRSARCTGCSPRLRWHSCPVGPAGRCGCRSCRSPRRSRCGRQATRWSAACDGR